MQSNQEKNRLFLREVNERIRLTNAGFAVTDRDVELFCECGGSGCLQLLEVPALVYDEVRGDSRLFIARPGHEQLGEDRVTANAQGYVVVRSRRRAHPGPLSAASASGDVQAPSPAGQREPTGSVQPA